MELHLANKTITVPEVIYLDQLAELDLAEFQTLQENPDQSRYIKWVLNFLKVLGISERISLPDFLKMQQSGEFERWLNALMADFRPSA